jgi:hypothetical protein
MQFNKHVCGLVAAGVTLFLFFCSAPVLAESQTQILAHLRQCDDALREGAIEYTHSCKINLPSKYNNTHLLYKKVSYTESAQLYYKADGRYYQKRVGAPPTTQEWIYNGTDYLQIFYQNDSFVGFHSASNFSKGDSRSQLIPGPCFALGRGLSSLQNIVISQDSTGIHLSGVAGKTAHLTAILDPAHGYIASQIRQVNVKGQTISTWTFDTPRQFNGSPYIAGNARYEAGNGVQDDHYLICKASFTDQSGNLFSYDWHSSGMKIVDYRVGDGAWVYLPNEVPKDYSSQQLLKLTEGKFAEQARIRKRAVTEGASLRMLMAIFSLLLLLGIIIFVRFSRKHTV